MVINLSRESGWEGREVVLYAVKMYLVCGLMLKKKLLPVMIELLVILHHLGVIYLRRAQKNTNFVTSHSLHPQKWTIDLSFKNKKICRHVTNFKSTSSMWTSHFYVGVINVLSLTCLLWYGFCSVLEKITILLFERNKPIIGILLKDISTP